MEFLPDTKQKEACLPIELGVFGAKTWFAISFSFSKQDRYQQTEASSLSPSRCSEAGALVLRGPSEAKGFAQPREEITLWPGNSSFLVSISRLSRKEPNFSQWCMVRG